MDKVFSKILKLIFKPSMESRVNERGKRKFVTGTSNLYFHHAFSRLR